MQDEKNHCKNKGPTFYVLKLLTFIEKCLYLGAPLHEMAWKSVLSLHLSSTGMSAAMRPQTCHAGLLQVLML